MLKQLLLILLIFSRLLMEAQNHQSDLQTIVNDSLAKTLFGNYSDSLKILTNQQMETLMNTFLTGSESIGFQFDSLRFVKCVQPNKADFRIITWVVPLMEKRFLYTGFIQKISNGQVAAVVRLESGKSGPDENSSYQKDDWPSAVYTQIIENKNDNGRFYTLIGWMGGGEGKARRVLEVLTFDQAGNPVFGAPVFITDNSKKSKSRVILEFTDQVPFHLGYEQQRLKNEKKKKWMIVFNHLSGNNPLFRNSFNALVPSYDKFDGYFFEDHKWHFVNDVDVRMDDKNSPGYKPPSEIGLEPK